MIIYTNGLNTSLVEAMEQRKFIADMTGEKTILNHNPSRTFASSLVESVWGRWFWWVKKTTPAKKLEELIKTNLEYPEDLYLLGHSQGTIITTNAVRNFTDVEKRNLIVFLFAPVNSFRAKDIHVEYFVNRADWVVNFIPGNYIIKTVLGVKRLFNTVSNKFGLVLEREGRGHSLIYSYLKRINQFRNYGESRFYKLTRKVEVQ